MSPAVLARYVGSYQFGPYSVMTIKLDGPQLEAQLTGQSFLPIYPSSDTAFFYKVVDAHMDFVMNAQGQVTGMEFYQSGHHISAARIDAATAQQLQSALEKRVSAQQPYPDSEQILQILLSGNAQSPRLSPALALAMQEQRARTETVFGKLGPVTSHQFIGVNPLGWDKYLVQHANGTEQVSFVLDKDGTVVGALRQP